MGTRIAYFVGVPVSCSAQNQRPQGCEEFSPVCCSFLAVKCPDVVGCDYSTWTGTSKVLLEMVNDDAQNLSWDTVMPKLVIVVRNA